MSGERFQFLASLIQVRKEDVNLKFIFDHFRNYLICAALLVAGGHLVTGVSNETLVGSVAGYGIAIIAIVLFLLNTFQGAWAISLIAFSSRTYIRGAYILIWVFIAAVSVNLVVSQVQ